MAASKRSGGTIDDLLVQAKITNRLIAAQLKEKMSQMDLVKLLSTTRATNQEIAEVLNTTAATVGTALQRIKKKTAAKKDSGDSSGAEPAA